MTTDTPGHLGLRNILIYVSLGGVFPPVTNSAGDAALLRAANLAMRRKEQGVRDIFLFLITGESSSTACEEAIKSYGFPVTEVAHLDHKPQQDESSVDQEALQEGVGLFVSSWLAKEHPGTIAYVQRSYDIGGFWWTGIEYIDDSFEWSFKASDFASELPDAHSKRAGTWLAILENALDLDAKSSTSLDGQRASLVAATLCEWLHGFEAASGNGYNHFDPGSAVNSLAIGDCFLGFEAARLLDSDLEQFCDDHDVEVDALSPAALLMITSDLRDALRKDLSHFFGGDGALFWALHSAIWPKLAKPMGEAFNELLNECVHEDFAELEAPWSFVTEGWCEDADQ